MNDTDRYSIDTYVKPLDSVVRSTVDESLGTVLSLVASSHTPVFIFDKEDNFSGLIVPYQTLYNHRFPYRTKASSIVFHPPKITRRTPLYDVASHMISLRVYTLPVFTDDGKIDGAVHGKDILQGLIEDKDLLRYVSEDIHPNEPITAHINVTVADIYSKMKEKGVSRIVLVDDEGDLTGIIARSDLVNNFMKPTDKQRFSKAHGDSGYFAFDEEKEYRRDDPVKKYYTDMVEAVSMSKPEEEIVKRLIASQHNSIVLVDKENKPAGFFSLRDIFQSLSELRPDREIPLVMNRPDESVSDEEMELVEETFGKFIQKITKRVTIDRIEVNTTLSKYPTGEPAEFSTTIVVTPVAGNKLIANTQRKTFIDTIQAGIDQILKQERRHDRTKDGTAYANP